MERRRALNANRIGQRRHKPDYLLLLLSVLLLAVGLVVVYAISPGLSAQKNVSPNYYVSKQTIAIALGFAGFAITANLPLGVWRRVEKPLLYAAAGSAVLVRLFGDKVNGAYRWIQIGGMSFQAAELIKFALLIWLAGFLSDRLKKGELHDFRKTAKPLLIAFVVVAVIMGGVQSDLGSTGVTVAIMAAMVFIVGLPLKRLVTIGGIVALCTILLIVSTPYRRGRLVTFLHPTSDCQNTGYQACQALIAVGSGGMFGLGLGRSVQAYGYLPEAANDSIFAIFAEKFGFIGITVLLGLFAAFFARLKSIMERAPNTYSRLLLAGILAWLSTQSIINIGAMIGLLPLKGITLPFISYGGTSIMFVMAAIGLAFQISRYTTYSVNETQTEENNNDNRTDRRRLRGAYHPGLSSR
jgi:cell division protein FtsW